MASDAPRKRVRADTSSPPSRIATAARRPRLFAPFRALGFVSNHVPFQLQSRGSRDARKLSVQVVTCLGTSWAMWDVERMTLLFVGPPTPAAITSLALSPDSVLAAAGSSVYRYVRGKEVARYDTGVVGLSGQPSTSSSTDDSSSDEDEDAEMVEASSSSGTSSLSSQMDEGEDARNGSSAGASADVRLLAQILVFGSQLIGLAEDGSRMFIWDIDSRELLRSVPFPPSFTATHVLHPATYLNKVLVASSQGEMMLWNIRTGTVIHHFVASRLRPMPSSASTTTGAHSITSLTQSPAIDVIAVSYLDGLVSLYDIRSDEEVMRVRMDGGVGQGGVAFRTDGQHVLATASLTGNIAMWDLNEGGKLVHTVKGAHDGVVAKLEWVPKQPVLISAGADNSVKQWLFDSPLAPPRLLKQRSGHYAPPHLIRYYGDDGKNILTAGRDRALRVTSVVRDSRSFEMSQGSLAKKSSSLLVPLASLKFTPITSLSFSTSRSKDWDDVLTAHADESFARTWTVKDKRLGSHKLGAGELGQGAIAKTVHVTACGNFGLVGSSHDGSIHMYNIQSGIHRKTFHTHAVAAEKAALAKLPKAKRKALTGEANGKEDVRSRDSKPSPVTGISSDSLNTVLVASTMDGRIHYFDFHSTKLLHVQTLPSSVTSILLHPDNGLLAAVCDDLTVRIIDVETRKVVREVGGFRGRILDIAYSPDARWLVTTSLDSVIRTFDIPTGRLIDAFRTESIATSLTFSPTGDFLATAHVDSVGVHLWANKSLFATVSLRNVAEEEIFEADMPTVQGLDEEQTEAAELEGVPPVGEPELKDIYTTPEQLDGDLLTLSLLPRSRWQTLINLETIKLRNKPKEAPKAPEKAPFFLPSLPGVEQRFDFGQVKGADKSLEQEDEPQSRRLRLGDAGGIETEFVRKIASAEGESKDFNSFFEYLNGLSPASIDLEMRSLVTLPHLSLFLRALIARLRSHRDFEAVQALLNVFIKIHGDVIIANPELEEEMRELIQEQEKESKRMMDLVHYVFGTLGFLRNVV